MLDAQDVWLICAFGFVVLGIAGLALARGLLITRRELKHVRKDVARSAIRIIDLEKAQAE